MPFFTNRGIMALPVAAPSGLEWDTGKTTPQVSLSGTPKLVATATGTTVSGDGTAGTSGSFHTTGKYYWEVTVTSAVGGGNNLGAGAISATFTMGSSGFVGGNTLSVGYYKDGNFYYNSTTAGTGAVLATGRVIGIAMDLTNNKIWFQRDVEGWKGSAGGADPVTNTAGINISTLNVSGGVGPAVDFETLENTSVLTANFGATPYFALVPFGFINLDGSDPTKQVWDPFVGKLSTGVTLDSTRLIATADGSASSGDHCTGYLSRSSGKVYWEVTVTSAGTGTPGFGSALVDSVYSSGVTGGDAHSLVFFNDGNIYFNAGIVGTAGTLTTGDVMKIAVDIGAKRVWVQKNSAGWQGASGAGDPVAGTNGIDISAMSSTVYPLVDIRNPSGIFTANFLTGAPSGYGYWV